MYNYLLAQPLAALSFYDSTDCCHWSLLQDCNPKLVAGASKVRGRFTGDPAHDYEGGRGALSSPARSSPDEETPARGVGYRQRDWRLAEEEGVPFESMLKLFICMSRGISNVNFTYVTTSVDFSTNAELGYLSVVI